jgi:hypothetical protein
MPDEEFKARSLNHFQTMPSIEIIEEDEDGGFDISGDSTPTPPPPQNHAEAVPKSPRRAALPTEASVVGACFIAR